MSNHTRTYVKVDNNWFREKRYIQRTGKLAFAVYVLILERVGCNSRAYININYLITQLGMNKNNGHMVMRIKEALTSLEAHNLIAFHGNMYNDDVVLLSDLNITKHTELYISMREVEERYTVIYADEIFSILLSDCEDYHGRVGMLAQFCYIITCINSLNNVCYPSMANIMEHSTVGSYHSIKKYLQHLVDLELLVISNAYVIDKKDGGISQTVNHYARPIHIAQLNAIVEEKVSKLSNKPMNKGVREAGRLKRSLSQKMNHILKKEKAGNITDEDRQEYNEMLEEYNQLCASTGQKPNFNADAKPKHTVLKIKGGVSKLHVDNETEEIHIEHNCTFDYEDDFDF